ncbi:Centromere-associated protein E [Chionoecetes opilio]|uniref:Kinesin-like protein n=1 Tax=Chionoecetes opilio TaxID=41210 RepID=A0A8J4YDG7_CHIOP|nr:Centromere-associated protein E [Chionoecetes opilio]
MEIYNENISDLLAGRDPKGRSLTVREDQTGTLYVAELKEEIANCEDQLLATVKMGEKNRHIASTNMNERSSRSHTILRVILESRERGDDESDEGAVTVSHLNLVDLAGSENASQSGATGERLREGGFINKSLFMLGRVISQLSEGEPYVNFRDSKLTRILQSSLGGNSKTAIICTVTSAAVEQTHSTLRFASRAKSIKNKPIVNEVLSDNALLKRYAREIKGLQHSLELERNKDSAQEVEQVCGTGGRISYVEQVREILGEQKRRNEELEVKIQELKTMLVVSSLPQGPSQPLPDKKKKARRETWCGPRMHNTRVSFGAALLPLPTLSHHYQDHQFATPRLPPWTETIAEGQSLDTTSLGLEQSIGQEEFGDNDVSFLLNQAEKSRLEKGDSSFQFSPCLVNTSRRRRKRRGFDIASPSPCTSEIACQTEESLAPQMRLLPHNPGTPPSSPRLPGTPGTPSHVLRARNTELREVLVEKEHWLNHWQKEFSSLREFHALELKVLEESYSEKMSAAAAASTTPADDDDDDKQSPQETDHINEIAQLKRSLLDYEQLLLDANRELSHNVQQSAVLQSQLEVLSEENIQLSGLQEEVVQLQTENCTLKKDLPCTKLAFQEALDSRVLQLSHERQDFDVMMDLARDNQKGKEDYLQKSLEQAWSDLAAWEKGDTGEVRRRGERLAQLQEEHTEALQQHLATVTQEGEELREEVADLQEYLSQVLSDQGTNRIQTLEQQVDDLKEKLENAKTQQQQKEEEEEDSSLSSPTLTVPERRGDTTTTLPDATTTTPPLPDITTTLPSHDFSRVLSETLQALEESMSVASTPGRRSFGSYLDGVSGQDLEAARPLVETLKAGLTALQHHIQGMEQQQHQAALATQQQHMLGKFDN